jgi:Tol biopolymer transport system component
MRLPIIPILIAGTILATVVYLFNSSGGPVHRILDAPRLTRLTDIEGIETEVALSPDGNRCAVIADGDLWIANPADGSRDKLTNTPEPESYPAWSPDGRRLTFSRGADTFVIPSDAKTGEEPQVFKRDASSLAWSPTGRLAFVRNRALWITDIGGKNEKLIVPADENPNITIRTPRFSPDSLQIAFIKSFLNQTGQVWTVDVLRDTPRALVSDRSAENPLDVGWIMEGRHLAYLTDRSGSYSIWHINFEDNTIMPLTQPLMDRPLAPIGISVWKDRIVLPRHFAESKIVVSDGKTVAQSAAMQIEPAASLDGKLIAYTVVKDNKLEVWTAGIDGSNPTFRTDGYEPRFAADGFHVVYTHVDLSGNADIWRIDIRNGDTDRITDAEELDLTPDPSPDGRWITFTSTRGVAPSIWIVPASGGKRLRLRDGGYGPRFSPDSKSILFWEKGSFWTMNINGGDVRPARLDISTVPSIAVWSKSSQLQLAGGEIRTADGKIAFKSDRPLWPRFDVLPDGRLLVAPIDIRETSLWAVDLQFKAQ